MTHERPHIHIQRPRPDLAWVRFAIVCKALSDLLQSGERVMARPVGSRTTARQTSRGLARSIGGT